MPLTTTERFWQKVDRTEACWNWTASLRNKGYGAFTYKQDGKAVQDRAHRYAWKLFHGVIPAGLCVLHRCDNPKCVNPAHLFLGTRGDNNADMVAKGRHVPGGTHTAGRYRRGNQHPNATLTEQEVLAIRAENASGESLGSISRRRGISVAHVHRIVHRKVWAHLGKEVPEP